MMKRVLTARDGNDKEYVDFILLTGGTDVNPYLYTSKADPRTQRPDVIRDEICFRLCERSFQSGKPIIGICRGLQFLNVFHKGTLHQHIDSHPSIANVITEAGNQFQATTDHHQAIDVIGNGGVKLAVSNAGFEIIQAVWWPEHKHLGVQFHPEWMIEDSPANVWLRRFIRENIGDIVND